MLQKRILICQRERSPPAPQPADQELFFVIVHSKDIITSRFEVFPD